MSQAFAEGMVSAFDLFGAFSNPARSIGYNLDRYSPSDTRPGFVKDAEALREDAARLRRDGMALFGAPVARRPKRRTKR